MASNRNHARRSASSIQVSIKLVVAYSLALLTTTCAARKLTTKALLSAWSSLIDCCINNAIDQRKKEGSSDCRMQPRSFFAELRTPSMERSTSSISSSTSLGQSVGQFLLGLRPDSLIGIEFRRVGRKVLDVQATMLPLKLLDGVSLVGGGVVQQHDHRAVQVAQQFAQEAADLLLADVVEEKQIIETQSMPPRAEGNAGDDTDLVSPSLAVTMNGCLPLRRPGPHHVGDEQKARFVGKDYVGAQPRSVFFMRGHSFCFQRAISSSSRSRARRSGFCALHPRLCIRRPT